jgi:hypothetical protein
VRIKAKKNTTGSDRVFFRLKETTTYRLVPDSTSVRLEALGSHRGLSETGLVVGLGALLGLSPQAKEETTDDKTFLLQLQGIGSTGSKSLYFGMQKLTLKENTVNRVRVAVGNKRAYSTLGNYEPSRLGGSIGVLGSSTPDSVVHYDTAYRLRPFLFFHVYIRRPTEPPVVKAERPLVGSVALAIGAQVKAERAFENLFVGTSLGHVLGDGGIAIGVNLRRIPADMEGRRIWKGGFGAGLNYAL